MRLNGGRTLLRLRLLPRLLLRLQLGLLLLLLPRMLLRALRWRRWRWRHRLPLLRLLLLPCRRWLAHVARRQARFCLRNQRAERQRVGIGRLRHGLCI